MFGQKIHEGNRLDESGFIATKGTPGTGKTEIMSTCIWAGGQQRNEGKYKFGEVNYEFREKAVYVMPYIEARYPDSGTMPSFLDIDNEGKRTPEIIEEFKRRYPAYAAHGDFIPLKLVK